MVVYDNLRLLDFLNFYHLMDKWEKIENLPQTSRETVLVLPPKHGAAADSAGKEYVVVVVLQRYWCTDGWRRKDSAGRPVSKGLFKSQMMIGGPWNRICYSSSVSLELPTQQMPQLDVFSIYLMSGILFTTTSICCPCSTAFEI